MKTKRLLCPVVAAIGIALVMAVSTSGTLASQATGEAIRVDSDDIGGVVTGPKGPEAGVWVIAETTGLPTKFVKIVVTDADALGPKQFVAYARDGLIHTYGSTAGAPNALLEVSGQAKHWVGTLEGLAGSVAWTR